MDTSFFPRTKVIYSIKSGSSSWCLASVSLAAALPYRLCLAQAGMVGSSSSRIAQIIGYMIHTPSP